MDPYNEKDRDRLSRAVEASYRALEPYRKLVHGLVEEYAGSGYGKGARTQQEIYLNLMHQTVDAYTMALVANRPKVVVKTDIPSQNFFAKKLEKATNNLVKEIGLEYTLRAWVLDSFFCLGIIKIHMANSGLVQIEPDVWMDPGKPFASNVSLDNWVHDVSATKFEEVKFAGDMYRIPFSDLVDNPDIYDAEIVAELQPSTKSAASSERLESISRGQEVDNDEYEPMIDLADIYIPRDNMVYTFPLKNADTFSIAGPPVAKMPWNGPEFGPYKLLGFNDVPENIMPTSPASHLAAMSRLVNNIMRKQARRARTAKRIHMYTATAAPDAKRLQKSPDDDFVQVNNVKELGTMEIGGIDPTAQAFLIGTIEAYDRMAGNLTAMLGLGSQAETLGQEQLIHSAASKKEAQMQFRVLDGANRVVRDLAWMLWNDAVKTMPAQLPIEGASEEYAVDATWTPEDREGDFLDYNFDIDVHSMPYQSPQQRVQALTTLLTQIYAPLMPMLQQQGGMVDLQALTETYADMMSLPEIRSIIKFMGMMPAQEGAGGGEEGGGMPAVTSRNYTRRNVPSGGTKENRATVAQQAWMSQAGQQSAGSSSE